MLFLLGDRITLKEIAARQEISEKYLESIARELVRAEILEGLRGKGGGYRLSRAADQINVLDALIVMEGTLRLSPVWRKTASRARAAGCRTLPLWKGLNEGITAYLGKYTVKDLIPKDPDNFDYVI